MVNRRVLAEAEFSLEDHSTLDAVQRLVGSDEPHYVRQALDVLESSEHESLDEHLLRLLGHPVAEVRGDALARIERRRTSTALAKVEALLAREGDPEIRGAALRTLGALSEEGDLERMVPFLQSEDLVLRRAAMVSMLRNGGIAGTLAVGQQLLSLQMAGDPAERILAAEVIGKVGARHIYQPLLHLLQDENDAVRVAALIAASNAPHPRLLELVIANLGNPATHSAAATVLAAFGEESQPLLENALAGRVEMNRETVIHLLRASGQVQSGEFVERLKGYIQHAEDDIRYQILLSLKRGGYRAAENEIPALIQAVRAEVAHGLRLLRSTQALETCRVRTCYGKPWRMN